MSLTFPWGDHWRATRTGKAKELRFWQWSQDLEKSHVGSLNKTCSLMFTLLLGTKRDGLAQKVTAQTEIVTHTHVPTFSKTWRILKEPPKIADPGCSKHIHIQKWQMNGSCKIAWALTKRLLVTTKGSRVILDTFSLRTYQMPMTDISGSQLAPQFSGLALGAGAWAQQAPLKLIEESAVVSTSRYWTCSLLDNIQDYTSIPVKSNP